MIQPRVYSNDHVFAAFPLRAHDAARVEHGGFTKINANGATAIHSA
jgi:hypothetical protein